MGVASTAQAGLINRGNGMIYDTDRNITWLADADYARTSGYDADGQMGWSAAVAWADNLIYGGYSDWRLPIILPFDTSCDSRNQGGGGLYCTGGEMEHLFYQELGGQALQSILTTHNANFNLFSNLADFYWSGTKYGPTYNFGWYFTFGAGAVNADFNPDPIHYAWAVRTGDVASTSVPEPGTIWLLLAGGLGWVGTHTRRRG